MLRQHFTGETVVEAARRRIGFVLDHFGPRVIVSVSGGKDSGVLAHLTLAEAHRRGLRIGIHLLDEEVMYESSVAQVDYLMGLMPDATKKMWLQVPFFLTNATSTTEGQLTCWEPGQHKAWMRPKRDDAIKAKPWTPEMETVRDRKKGFGFYDAIDTFARCYENTAFLVGLRAAGESPNRWRAVTKNPIDIGGTSVFWGTRKERNVTLYPIFDWNLHDVFKYHAEEGLRYSRIYDLQLKKGYPINRMRVSSLIHEQSFQSIADLPEFEPKTYARLQKRIKAGDGQGRQALRMPEAPQEFQVVGRLPGFPTPDVRASGAPADLRGAVRAAPHERIRGPSAVPTTHPRRHRKHARRG